MSREIKFTTEVEHPTTGKRVTVEVEATYSPASSEQEYPGAHVWRYPASMEIDSVKVEGTDEEIPFESLNKLQQEYLEKGAYASMNGEKIISEFTYEDEAEAHHARRFEDMAYGPPDYD